MFNSNGTGLEQATLILLLVLVFGAPVAAVAHPFLDTLCVLFFLGVALWAAAWTASAVGRAISRQAKAHPREWLGVIGATAALSLAFPVIRTVTTPAMPPSVIESLAFGVMTTAGGAAGVFVLRRAFTRTLSGRRLMQAALFPVMLIVWACEKDAGTGEAVIATVSVLVFVGLLVRQNELQREDRLREDREARAAGKLRLLDLTPADREIRLAAWTPWLAIGVILAIWTAWVSVQPRPPATFGITLGVAIMMTIFSVAGLYLLSPLYRWARAWKSGIVLGIIGLALATAGTIVNPFVPLQLAMLGLLFGIARKLPGNWVLPAMALALIGAALVSTGPGTLFVFVLLWSSLQSWRETRALHTRSGVVRPTLPALTT
jgi:hypothetical protein